MRILLLNSFKSISNKTKLILFYYKRVWLWRVWTHF